MMFEFENASILETELKISKEHDLVVFLVPYFAGFALNLVNSVHRDHKVGLTCAVLLCGKLSPTVS